MLKTFLAAALAGTLSPPVATLASAAGDKPSTTSSAEGAKDSAATGSTAVGFDRLDRNRDGYVSRDEARDAPELQTRFSELDKNNDGKLSREEYDALKAEAAGARGSTARSK